MAQQQGGTQGGQQGNQQPQKVILRSRGQSPAQNARRPN